MTIPTQINVPTSPFNAQQRVYNGEGVPKTRTTFLSRVVDLVSTDGQAPPSGVPTVLTDFAATPSDLANAPVVVTDVTDTVPRTPVNGSFSAVRARRILHQYRIGFWSTAGIIDQETASQAADPTQDQIDTAWNNFQVFSYLPPALMPTKEEFSDLITPSKSASNVLAALPSMGINTSVVTNPSPTQISNPSTPVLQPTVPFASNLSQFCPV